MPDCGHEVFSFPTNVFKNDALLCPVCSGHQVQRSVNDLWTTHPYLASKLININDGYHYSFGSNKKLQWKCDVCGAIISKTPNKMSKTTCVCKRCRSTKSYGEKFFISVLNQLCEIYDTEVRFGWSEHKRYDFYLPEYNIIVEIHGSQHSSSKDFSLLGGRTYIEESINDDIKKDLALKNHISEYIVINNIYSDAKDLKFNIMNSLLPTILNFSSNDINWTECHQFALSSDTKSICEYYNLYEANIPKLADIFNKSQTTIRKYLKQGNECGLCNYNAKKSKADANRKAVKTMISQRSKSILQLNLDDEVLEVYPSIQEAQRILNISHIWDCLAGKRKTAGGYKWKYNQ